MSGEALFCSTTTADRPNYEPHTMSMEIARLMAEANLLRSRHKVSEAVQLFQRVLELDERHADALNCKGVCLKQLGDLAGALQAYQQVLELDPQNWCAYNNLGVLYKEQNQVHEAVTSYHAAIMHGPADCIARANMATLLTELGSHFKEIGELGRALSHYREAVSLNPQYAPALFSLGMIGFPCFSIRIL
jgi:Flp pilus assembly protein TadD